MLINQQHQLLLQFEVGNCKILLKLVISTRIEHLEHF